MAGKNVAIVISAKDEASSKISKVTGKMNELAKGAKNSDLGKFNQSLNSMKKAFGPVTAAISAGVTTLKAYSKAIADTAEAYNTQLVGEKQLEVAMRNNPMLAGTSVKALKDYASQLQSISKYGDEELLPMMAELAAQGRSQEQIFKIMQSAVDLSAGGMVSLDTAVTQISNTLNGTSGTLGKFVPQLKELTAEELAAGKGVEVIEASYAGLSKELTEATGSTQQMKMAYGDMMESIGAWTKPITDAIANAFTNLFKGITDGINKLNHELDVKIIGKSIVKGIMVNARNGQWSDLSGLTDEELELARQYAANSNSDNINALQDINKERTKRARAAYNTRQNALVAPTVKVNSSSTSRATTVVDDSAKRIADAIADYEKEQTELQYEYEQIEADYNGYLTDLVTAEIEQKKQNAQSIIGLGGNTGSFINSLLSSDGPLDTIITLLEPLLEDLTEVSAGWDQFTSAIDDIYEILANDLAPVFDSVILPVLDVLGDVIEVLNPIITAAADLLAIVADAVVGLLTWLEPVLQFVAEIVRTVVNWVIRIYNKIIDILNWFRWDKIGYASEVGTTGFQSTSTSSTSSGSASYSGAKDVYVNIYFNNSMCTGDAREIALFLRDEVIAAEKLGY